MNKVEFYFYSTDRRKLLIFREYSLDVRRPLRKDPPLRRKRREVDFLLYLTPYPNYQLVIFVFITIVILI